MSKWNERQTRVLTALEAMKQMRRLPSERPGFVRHDAEVSEVMTELAGDYMPGVRQVDAKEIEAKHDALAAMFLSDEEASKNGMGC